MLRKSVIAAAALSLALAAGAPVLAQDEHQLGEELHASLLQLGFAPDDIGSVSVEQATEIESVVNSSDTDEEKKEQIEMILAQE
jgi:hypothetical protein